jgi:C-5 cytosine-specific DNA methylase
MLPDVHEDLFFGDVADLEESKLLEVVRIDVVTGGFPCQGLSKNNTHKRHGFESEVQLHKAIVLCDWLCNIPCPSCPRMILKTKLEALYHLADHWSIPSVRRVAGLEVQAHRRHQVSGVGEC